MKYLLIVVLAIISIVGQAQKASDLTITFSNTVASTNTDPKATANTSNATMTVYTKGSNYRTEKVNSLGVSTMIYDAKAKKGAILKEFGKQKILVKLSDENIKDINKSNANIVFAASTETKTIAGYNCTKATGKMSDGSDLVVYYTKDLSTDANYEPMYQSLGGIVLQSEVSTTTAKGTIKVTTTATKVATTPVLAAKFSIPKEGYREMTYEESIK